MAVGERRSLLSSLGLRVWRERQRTALASNIRRLRAEVLVDDETCLHHHPLLRRCRRRSHSHAVVLLCRRSLHILRSTFTHELPAQSRVAADRLLELVSPHARASPLQHITTSPARPQHLSPALSERQLPDKTLSTARGGPRDAILPLTNPACFDRAAPPAYSAHDGCRPRESTAPSHARGRNPQFLPCRLATPTSTQHLVIVR